MSKELEVVFIVLFFVGRLRPINRINAYLGFTNFANLFGNILIRRVMGHVDLTVPNLTH